MVASISGAIENETLLQKLRESEHYALTFDETTDSTTVAKWAIHCRYVFNATVRYLPLTDVLGSLDIRLSKEGAVVVNIVKTVGDVTVKGPSFETFCGIAAPGTCYDRKEMGNSEIAN